MATRRKFIQLIPVAGVALLAACKEKAPEAPAIDPVPAPEPAAEPAPAPTAEAAPAEAPAADAAAATTEVLSPQDPQAVSLGYVTEASTTDTAKYPKYVAGQKCSNCVLYAGAADSAQAACGLFGGKLVANGGWCSAYAPKAAA